MPLTVSTDIYHHIKSSVRRNYQIRRASWVKSGQKSAKQKTEQSVYGTLADSVAFSLSAALILISFLTCQTHASFTLHSWVTLTVLKSFPKQKPLYRGMWHEQWTVPPSVPTQPQLIDHWQLIQRHSFSSGASRDKIICYSTLFDWGSQTSLKQMRVFLCASPQGVWNIWRACKVRTVFEADMQIHFCKTE